MRMNENIVSHTNKGRYFLYFNKKGSIDKYRADQNSKQHSTNEMKKQEVAIKKSLIHICARLHFF